MLRPWMRGHRRVAAGPGDHLTCGRYQGINRQPEFRIEVRSRRRGPEIVESDHGSIEADVPLPSEARGCFDGDASARSSGQHVVPIAGGLALEELPRWKAHPPGRDACLLELDARRQREVDLRA